MSRDQDFAKDPKQCFYDVDDQITNIVMMHEIVEEERKPAKRQEKQLKKEKRLKRKRGRQKLREELQRKWQTE
jgi:hypothetical protein